MYGCVPLPVLFNMIVSCDWRVSLLINLVVVGDGDSVFMEIYAFGGSDGGGK